MLHVKLDDLIADPDHVWGFEQVITFNGGEENVRFKHTEYIYDNVIIEVSLTSSKKVMQLLMVTDAVKRMGYREISLFAPYLPYARQDRVCNPGEALSAKVMCGLINSQGYSKVYTLDNHSEVSTALINNYSPIDLVGIIRRMLPFTNDLANYVLVCPDAGAQKRVYKLAKELGNLEVIECGKKRDVATGSITKTVVYTDLSIGRLKKYRNYLMVDDICDGGRTFVELAKALRNDLGPQGDVRDEYFVDLFVSHGIFSQGIKVLTDKSEPYNGVIDSVYTTRSFLNDVPVKREAFYESDFI